MKKEIYVRNLEKHDLPAIVTMEERQTGVARPITGMHYQKELAA